MQSTPFRTPSPRVAVIGAGAMARALAAGLAGGDPPLRIGAVLARRPPAAPAFDGMAVCADAAGLLAWGPDLVVECAGHGAMRDLVPACLAAGVDCIIASVGALAEPAVLADVRAAAERGRARLVVPAGALGGLDALAAARLAGLTAVTYRGSKPPAAWKGTPAEEACDLDALERPAIVFEGSAAEAAARFPRNANVTAALALAGLGPEATRVTLVADPGLVANTHRIEAEGAFGRFVFETENRALPDNPRTSLLAALSLQHAVLNHVAPLIP